MHYYAPDDNKKGRLWAAAATLLGYALCVALMLFIRFDLSREQQEGGGMLVDFGDVEMAGGEQDTDMTDEIAATSSQSASENTPDPLSENGDVEVPARQQPETRTQPAEQPRTADPRALFPGRTAGSTSTSEGGAAGAGNEGDPAGSPGGTGTGTGTEGTSFNLAGRSPVGDLPKPAYSGRRQGKVVIEIIVNVAGEVMRATYLATGSTIIETAIVEDALRAARRTRFNDIEGDGLQTGTITYIFRMN
jgi:TonB family protein